MENKKYKIQDFLKSISSLNKTSYEKTPFSVFLINQIEEIKDKKNPELTEDLLDLVEFLKKSEKKEKKEILKGMISFLELDLFSENRIKNKSFIKTAAKNKRIFNEIILGVMESGVEVVDGKIKLDKTIGQILALKSIESFGIKVFEENDLNTAINNSIKKDRNTVFSRFSKSNAIDLFVFDFLDGINFIEEDKVIEIKKKTQEKLKESGMTESDFEETRSKIKIIDFDTEYGSVYKVDDNINVKINSLKNRMKMFDSKIFSGYCSDNNIVYVSAFEKIQWQTIGENNELFKGNMSVPSFVLKNKEGDFEKIILNISPITGNLNFEEEDDLLRNIELSIQYCKSLELESIEFITNKSPDNEFYEIIKKECQKEEIKELFKEGIPMKIKVPKEYEKDFEQINKSSTQFKAQKQKIQKK